MIDSHQQVVARHRPWGLRAAGICCNASSWYSMVVTFHIELHRDRRPRGLRGLAGRVDHPRPRAAVDEAMQERGGAGVPGEEGRERIEMTVVPDEPPAVAPGRADAGHRGEAGRAAAPAGPP